MMIMNFDTLIPLRIIGDGFVRPAHGQINIAWNLSIESRTYGIKSFVVSVPEQTITTTVTEYDENDEEIHREVVLEIKDVKVVMNQNSSNINSLSMIPNNLEIFGISAELEFK